MGVNVKALLSLFPKKEKRTQVSESAADLTIKGACPFDQFKWGFTGNFVKVIEDVREHDHWGPLFYGDLSQYENDHSKADLAMCGELARRGLNGPQIDIAIRSSGLYREKWEERNDYRTNTIKEALKRPSGQLEGSNTKHDERLTRTRLDLEDGRVDINRAPPKARDWTVENILLSGKSAVLAGFGGVSKTQLAIQLCVDVVLGRPSANHQTKQGRAMILLGEEDRDEVQRRVNALVRCHKFTDSEIDLLKHNLRAFPFISKDMRLTRKEGWALHETRFEREIIDAARAFGDVNLIVLDHLSLVHGGDFNAREHATLTMRLVNHIAEETGAAVLVLAHSPKSSMNSEESDAAAVSGSAVFVDQARAAGVLATMRPQEAKKYGIENEQRKQHVSLTMAKMNYGPTGDAIWFRRVPFDDIAVLEPVELSPSTPVSKGDAGLEERILKLVGDNPGQYSRTRFREKYSGKDGVLRASKATVARVLDDLAEDGRLFLREPTDAERKDHRLGGQVRGVLCLWDPTQ